jgi:hypothetical protein
MRSDASVTTGEKEEKQSCKSIDRKKQATPQQKKNKPSTLSPLKTTIEHIKIGFHVMKNRPSPLVKVEKKKSNKKIKLKTKTRLPERTQNEWNTFTFKKIVKAAESIGPRQIQASPPEKKFLKNCFMLGCVDKSSEKKVYR